MTFLIHSLAQGVLWWFHLLQSHADQIVGGFLLLFFGFTSAWIMSEVAQGGEYEG